ncbi:MAG: hypothetical protein M3O28_13765 [Actinomycetota bacterium]|nr:hypothetical protein [Actinomycetota bacterium]
MRNPRRITALSLALGVFFAMLTVLGISAPSASAYAVKGCPTISLSSTAPVAGTSITVSGANFASNVSITIVLEASPDTHGHLTVKTLTTSSTGTFSFLFVVPDEVGQHILVATDVALTAPCPADPFASIDIRAASSGGSGTGGLASTGTDIAGGVAVALALLLIGSLLTFSGQRKRRRPHSHSG